MALIPIDASGPEDVIVRGEDLITGVADGRILRVTPDTGRVDTIGDTGGRPLGLEALPDGRLLICDARRGLLAFDPASGRIETLLREAGDRPLRFCNNAAVARDGTVYVSDSSRHFGIDNWRGEIIQHTGTGRVLRRTPDGEVDVVADGLQFANGVALADDESYLLVAETGGYRIRRIWLTGDRAGRDEAPLELPGFPDNLSSGTGGLIWVAVASPRDPVFDVVVRTPPVVRGVVRAIPQRLQPAPKRTMRVMAVDRTGQIRYDLSGPGDRYHFVTGVREHAGRLYLGSLVQRSIAVADLPPG